MRNKAHAEFAAERADEDGSAKADYGRYGSRASEREVRDELARILGSPLFRTSECQRSFLKYVVEEAVAGRADQIKEYSVGVAVFQRGEGFDPRKDTIVRTEARNLRKRLAQYYVTDGQRNPLRIDLPKGGYAPCFVKTGFPEPVAAPAKSAIPENPAIPGIPKVQPVVMRAMSTSASILVILLLAGSIVALARYTRQEPSGPPSSPSIAVLPFLNMDGERSDEFFSDGLTEELIEELTRVPGLHVVARTSAFQFKGRTVDVRDIGRRLGVRTVLEGSVRRAGNRVRISAQLNETAHGYHLWAQSYDRESTDALSIQREISVAIASALGVELACRTSGYEAPPEIARNTKAHEDYLKGRYFWSKITAESLLTAIDYFKQAIAEDPNYASAHAALARSYVGVPMFTSTPTRDVIPKIKAEAQKALELDNTLDEAHISLAYAFMDEFDWAASENEFRKAVELTPNDAIAHNWYSVFLQKTGRLQEALSESRAAVDLDPVSPFSAQNMAKTFCLMHRFPDAIAQYRKALALDPNFWMAHQGLGMALLQSGNVSQGVAESELADQLMGGDPSVKGQLGYAYGVAGKPEKAREVLSFLLAKSAGEVPVLAVATIYAGLQDRDHALEWLRKAVDQQSVNLLLKADPVFDPLRSDPRFAELLRRAKLG